MKRIICVILLVLSIIIIPLNSFGAKVTTHIISTNDFIELLKDPNALDTYTSADKEIDPNIAIIVNDLDEDIKNLMN